MSSSVKTFLAWPAFCDLALRAAAASGLLLSLVEEVADEDPEEVADEDAEGVDDGLEADDS